MTIRHMSDIYETYIRTRVKKYNTKMEEIVRPQLTVGLSDVSSMICCKTPTITHCAIPTLTIVYLGGVETRGFKKLAIGIVASPS